MRPFGMRLGTPQATSISVDRRPDRETASDPEVLVAGDYKESRPHTALGGLAPREYVTQLLAEEVLEEAI